MKKTIHLFLASSITDLSDDRQAIGDFVNTLNNIYNSQNLFIHLHKCEDESEDHTIIKGGTQKTLNDEIRESDFCFVVFWHKAGDVTEQELRVALEEFKIKSNPKIVVYFKSLSEGESLADDVRRVMEDIDQNLLHYHREYSHIDSLKLGIITQLQVHGFLRAEMKVEDEHVIVSGHKVVSTEHIPVYSQNEEYLELLKDLRVAEQECAKRYSIYEQDRNNTRAYKAYQKAVKEKLRVQEDLKEISDEILKIGTKIAKTISTSAPTELILKAIQCFDRGDYDGVLDILHPDEIDDCFVQANKMERLAEEQAKMIRQGGIEKANMVRQSGIDEYRYRILALEAQGKWGLVYENYERVISQVEGELNAPKTIMLEYVRFLYRQKNYEKSLDACKKLQSALVQNSNAISEQEIAELYDLQGELYYYTNNFRDAEAFLKKAIDHRKASIEQGQERDMLIAESSVKLAKVYYMITRFFEAENLYIQALDYYKAYDTEAIEAVDVDIARTSLELGNLYYMINRHEDARKLFIAAYHKYTELVNSGGKCYTAELAESCNKIAFLDIAVYSHRKVEHYYVQAMKIKQLMTRKDPVAYYIFLERILKKLGHYWKENGEIDTGNLFLQEAERIKSVIQNKTYADEREEYRALDYDYYKQPIDKPFIESILRESLRHYKLLADENPEAFEPSLAQAYNVTGTFYTQTGEKQKAEVNYAEAIAIRERLVNREHSMKPALAASFSNLSQHYVVWDQYGKAEKYALQAIDIYKDVTKGETGAYNTDLARNYFVLANLYAKEGKDKQAEDCYKDSILMYIKLFEKSPRAYIDRIINTVNKTITLFDPIESTKWMEEFVDENKVAEWLSKGE